MSNLLDEWASEFRSLYRNEIETLIQEKITEKAQKLTQLVNVDVDVDNITRIYATISHLKRVLYSMQNDDIRCYKDYLKACIIEAYTTKNDRYDHIEVFCEKYNATRTQRLNRLKGVFVQKISKY